jgi:Fe-S-cluster containining protein
VADQGKSCWYVGGLHFECVQCGNCCSGPAEGYIWVTRPEIDLIAAFLKMTPGHVRQQYTQRLGFRTTIIEQPVTNDCVFLQEENGQKQCMIYPVRPSQCRNWPFWPSNLTSPAAWNQATKKCCGINRGGLYSFKQIRKIKKAKKWWLNAHKEVKCSKK